MGIVGSSVVVARCAIVGAMLGFGVVKRLTLGLERFRVARVGQAARVFS